jgi:hypothetical protein
VSSYRDQREVLKAVATTLKQTSLPFALAGGYAVWARGGPESEHDVDFALRPSDADAARAAVLANGLSEHPSSEDWLAKVTARGVVVDLIHRLPVGDVDDALLSRCDALPVDSVRMPVLAATDLLLCRILVLSDHACDFAPVLGFARALREQVDWSRVRRETVGHPFAEAFLHLLVSLEVIDAVERVA